MVCPYSLAAVGPPQFSTENSTTKITRYATWEAPSGTIPSLPFMSCHTLTRFGIRRYSCPLSLITPFTTYFHSNFPTRSLASKHCVSYKKWVQWRRWAWSAPYHRWALCGVFYSRQWAPSTLVTVDLYHTLHFLPILRLLSLHDEVLSAAAPSSVPSLWCPHWRYTCVKQWTAAIWQIFWEGVSI